MTGSAGSDLLVSGIFNMATGVPGHGLNNPLSIFKRRLHAPETTTGKDGGFITGRGNPVG